MTWSDNLDENSNAYLIAASAERYIRVIAGPGTGKSFAMKRRVARLLESGISPKEILPVTFTRVAAEDLHRELVGMGVQGCEELEGTTLHSLSLRVLKRNRVLQATGRTARPLAEFESDALLHDLALATGMGIRQVRKQVRAYESAWARLQPDEPGYAQSAADAQFEHRLLDWLVFHRGMLIGEVIPQLYRYLRSNPAAEERTEFSHILVDEYQDLNKAEQGLVSLLSERAAVCVVGDDDQSLYSFKHAHPDGIREWLTDHPDANDLSLDECRRCPTSVVRIANSLISHNRNRPIPRQLTERPENAQGKVAIIQYPALDNEIDGVVRIVKHEIASGTRPGDILVLAQRNALGTRLYEALAQQQVPVESYYAESELEAEEAQNRFALLKLFSDRDDRVSLRWLLGLHHSNKRSAPYSRLRQYCEQNSVTPWSALNRLARREIAIPRTGGLVDRFQAIMAEVEQLESLVQNGGLLAVVDSLFPSNDNTVRDLRSVAIKVIDDNPEIQPAEFVRELVSAIAKPEIPLIVEDVRIMSLHKSKGLSSPVTIIAGCVDGLLPKQPDSELPIAEQEAIMEEQRRLLYVGITRVKAGPDHLPGKLFLTCSLRMPVNVARRAGIEPTRVHRGDAILMASRFIQELGPAAPSPVAG